MSFCVESPPVSVHCPGVNVSVNGYLSQPSEVLLLFTEWQLGRQGEDYKQNSNVFHRIELHVNQIPQTTNKTACAFFYGLFLHWLWKIKIYSLTWPHEWSPFTNHIFVSDSWTGLCGQKHTLKTHCCSLVPLLHTPYLFLCYWLEGRTQWGQGYQPQRSSC